jgi:hypothetical protein
MTLRQILVGTASVVALGLAASPASASAQDVTYSWTTTSQGFGNNVSQPTTATFKVALSAVQTGRINLSDIKNIQLTYPGLFFDAFTASSGGLDNATFVNPVTGALIYKSPDQGLAVIGYQGGLFSDSFLSITVGNRFSPFGAPLTSVSDQFNALKNGGPFAGFPTAGYWTAQLPGGIGVVPEPSTWAMLILGFGLIGSAVRAKKQRQKITVSYS